MLSFASLPGATLFQDERGAWLDSGLNSSTYNSVVSAHLGPESADAYIAAITSHFRRHARPVTWHIGPTSTPSDLGDRLLTHGWTRSYDEPGMAIDLANLPDEVALPEGFAIERIEDERGLSEWVSTYYSEMPLEVQRLQDRVLKQHGVGNQLPWQYYLGRIDGRPVATSELFMDAGTAGIQNVVTMPEARRRGIGTAMTLYALRDARTRGCRVGALTSSPVGIWLYQSIGFREYCWIHRYEWKPDQNTTPSTGS